MCIEKTGTSFELFINNVSQGTVSSGTYGLADNRLSFGAPQDGFGNRSNSQLDIWSTWTRVLGSTDRATLYNSGSGIQYPFASAVNSGFFLAASR